MSDQSHETPVTATSDDATTSDATTSDATTSDAVVTDEAVIAAVGDGAYTLLVADFSDVTVAEEAYETLKSMEDGRTVAIDGVIVVKRDTDGELSIQEATDHSTRSGFRWGLVGGIALGVIFPPSILGSAAVVGGAGAATGKLRQIHHKSELADELGDAIQPGHSGLVALVSDPGVVEVRRALNAANAIVQSAVDHVAAKDIKAAAKEADAENKDADKDEKDSKDESKDA